jgi:predicted patatin/cPLA2 family phospholipase
MKQFDSITFSSGSIKGISFIGVLKYFYENKIHTNEYRGTSIGALFAFMCILNLNIEELDTLKVFSKEIPLLKPSIINFIKHFSFSNNNILTTIIDYCLTCRNLNQDITFKQLYTISKKKLIIFVVELHSGELINVDYTTFPNACVKTFLLASMALPLLFPPIKYNKIYYIDGAICNNGQFPLVKNNMGNHLGICIETVESCISEKKLTLKIYLKSIFEILTKKQKCDYKNTIIVTIKTDIHSLNFVSIVNNENYNILVENGYRSIKNVFEN